jgi:hypothetical protein
VYMHVAEGDQQTLSFAVVLFLHRNEENGCTLI